MLNSIDKRFVSYVILLLFTLSCSVNKNGINNDKKSKNNFLAYYNTFFTAEKNYNDALELMQINSEDDNNLSSQVNRLLDISIQNCLIIERDFYQTKYLDDAYYILAMSSFYKDKITASEYYFNKLLNDFPNTVHVNNINIYMSYINLKVGKVNEFKNCIDNLDLSKFNNEEMYNYYLLMAYYYEDFNDYNIIIENYLNAIDFADTKIRKFYLYNKLLEYSELIFDYNDCVKYIEMIQKNNNVNKLEKELFSKWIKYKHQIKEHNDVSRKLESLLNNAKSLKDKLFYEIGIARSLMHLGEYDDAIETINNIIDKNSSSTVIKNELSEMYYLLGRIYFITNEYELAQENYQLSIDKSRTSDYGKKSENQISALIKYTNYIQEIDFINLSIDENDKDFVAYNNNLDSLYFHLAQIQYFDLDLLDSSLLNFKMIIRKFPDSPFREKSLIAMSINEPDTIWTQILQEQYLNNYKINEDEKLDEISKLIDDAWSLMNKQDNSSISEFKRIYELYNNDKALYIIAFIYDTYKHDIVNAMKYYKIYLEQHIDGEFYKIINDRVLEVKNLYEDQISLSNQKIAFIKGFNFLKGDIIVDSSNFYFDISSNGDDRSINLYSKSLREKALEYDNNIKIYIESLSENNNYNIDSIGFNLANLFYSDFDSDSLAKKYYLEIIKNKNDYNDISYAALLKIDVSGGWDSLLYNSLEDSIKYNKMIKSVVKGDHLSRIRSINLPQEIEDLSWLNGNYNTFFKSNNEDSLKNNYKNKKELEDDSNINKTKNLNQNSKDAFKKTEDSTMIKNNLMKSYRDSLQLKVNSITE